MKGLFRALLAAVGVIALVVVGGVIYATTFFDPNDLKPRLIEAAKQRTGLDVALDGPISWTFYPRLGVTVEDVTVRLPDQPADSIPFAALDRADVKVRFAPLLAGDISIDGVVVDGLSLELERDDSGRGNWQAIADHFADPVASAEPPVEVAPAQRLSDDDWFSQVDTGERSSAPRTPAERPLAVDISTVQVTQGRVHYVDHYLYQGSDRPPLDIRLDNLRFNGSNVAPGHFFPIELAFELNSQAPELSSQVTLNARVKGDPGRGLYAVESLALGTNSSIPALGPERSQRLDLTLPSLEIALDRGRYRASGVSFNGELHPQAFDGNALPLRLGFDLDADMLEQSVRLDALQLDSASQLKLSGSLLIESLFDTPRYQGLLALADGSLRGWLADRGVGLESMAGDQALNEVGFDAALSGEGSRLTLSDLQARIDGQTLEGMLAVGFDIRALDFDLRSPSLDLDPYLPPREAFEQDAAAGRSGGWLISRAFAEGDATAITPLPSFDALNESAIDGRLAIDRLKLRGVDFDQASLRFTNDHGQLALQHFSAGLYGGRISATGSADLRQSPISLDLSPQVEGVALEPILSAYSNESDQRFAGNLQAQAQLATQADSVEALLGNLSGQGRIAIVDGRLRGVDVPGQICSAAATLSASQPSREPQSDTPIERLEGTFTIDHGVVHSDDLEGAVPGLGLTGAGQSDLAAHRFDVLFHAGFVDDPTQRACGVSAQLSRIRLPLRCEGEYAGAPGEWCRFDQVAFAEELERGGREALKQHLNDVLEGDIGARIDDALGTQDGQRVRDVLRGLFN
ncbi:AsmA family protein [Halotalea alkalilenta]|uniref:AsmA family protein n=1 Tax=Halotalea alkalilenta TaxID=376489 RepID=UPI000480E9D1|nr:AsmA family protein [Halotalea alkalilenta]